jgi:hypothetical protein
VRKREHHVEVLQGQQLGAASLEPTLAGERGALGAVAVAAGVIDRAFGLAAIAALEMSPESRRSARLDRVDHAPLLHRCTSSDRSCVGAEEIGELDFARSSRRPLRGRGVHGLPIGGRRELQAIER